MKRPTTFLSTPVTNRHKAMPGHRLCAIQRDSNSCGSGLKSVIGGSYNSLGSGDCRPGFDPRPGAQAHYDADESAADLPGRSRAVGTPLCGHCPQAVCVSVWFRRAVLLLGRITPPGMAAQLETLGELGPRQMLPAELPADARPLNYYYHLLLIELAAVGYAAVARRLYLKLFPATAWHRLLPRRFPQSCSIRFARTTWGTSTIIPACC